MQLVRPEPIPFAAPTTRRIQANQTSKKLTEGFAARPARAWATPSLNTALRQVRPIQTLS
jgi:hypothetical protein